MEKSELPAFDTLWNYQKPEETEEKFRQILPLAEQSGDAAYRAGERSKSSAFIPASPARGEAAAGGRPGPDSTARRASPASGR